MARTSSAAAEHFPGGGDYSGTFQRSQRAQLSHFQMHICSERTQVPVRQRVVIVVLVLVDVLPFLAVPAFMLQSDGAGLVETRLDVLLTIRNRLILFNITLQDNSEKVEWRAGVCIRTGRAIRLRNNCHTCTEC